MNRTLQTDWIHFEATSDTLEIHRGRKIITICTHQKWQRKVCENLN